MRQGTHRLHQRSATRPPRPASRVVKGIATLVLLPTFSTLPAAAATTLDALAERGLALSKLHCARCHIISDTNRFTGTSSTPAFQTLIRYLDDWQERFDSFLARKPHPAHIRLEGDDPRPEALPATIREVILTLDDIEAIRAYVDQLARDMDRAPR